MKIKQEGKFSFLWRNASKTLQPKEKGGQATWKWPEAVLGQVRWQKDTWITWRVGSSLLGARGQQPEWRRRWWAQQPDVRPPELPYIPCPTPPPMAPSSPSCYSQLLQSQGLKSEWGASQHPTGKMENLVQSSPGPLRYPKAPLSSLPFELSLPCIPFIMFPGHLLSPVQGLLSMPITYSINGKPIYLFDIHHSLQPSSPSTSPKKPFFFFLFILCVFGTKKMLFKEWVCEYMTH